MFQIKVFRATTTIGLEKDVNEWLKDTPSTGPDAKMKFISMMQSEYVSADTLRYWGITLTIFYSDRKSNDTLDIEK